MSSDAEKALLRKQFLQNTNALHFNFLQAAALEFTARLTVMDAYRRASSVFIYVSVRNEPETRLMIIHALQNGKQVFVPKCLPHHKMIAVRIDETTCFDLNAYSIPEPVCESERRKANELDLCVIPCVAAAPDGRRLGHGGGYYDRFLAGADTCKVCLCYEMNLSDAIPRAPYDISMNMILTEKRQIVCI